MISTPFVQSTCRRGCDLAFGLYYIEPGNDVASISRFMNTIPSNIFKYNPNTIRNEDNLTYYTRINLPFSCDCIDGEFLAHVFTYDFESVDTYESVAQQRYANLTTEDWIQRFNVYNPDRVPDGANINVTVNCSCGDGSISKDYGLFVTYPLRPGETLDSVSSAANLSSDLIRSYNPDVNFTQGSGLVYIPARGLSVGAIFGITIGVVVVVVILFLAGCLVYINKNAESGSAMLRNAQVVQGGVRAAGLTSMTVNISMEFSYEELSAATNDFSLANKIGQGGFGSVYYAELKGEKTAIKKMDMKASRQFLAELKVLTHTHHLNLVRLIGYCVEGSLFLVYEYIENGNLSQHLHGSERAFPWSTRIQVALDAAKGLEYIHEHTVPVYVHCDIKSANILIDKNLHGKVADFGLTRLTKVGSKSHLMGTFGYMPPEYVRLGKVSPLVDVYAFGVVLYELISAKQAIIRANDSDDGPKSLIDLFDEVLSQVDSKDDLMKVIDPRLGGDYPLDSVHKMAQLAKACTHEDPRLRPSMRHVVVALMTLSSFTEDWNISSFYENKTLVSLMSGK
ncbi:hypothetical protein E3N88_08977 [Mikania micrantha]|uniref:non-specific serine/threonine protein kinase n=2 Tax=Mikania micrantha TaxID=192012 RepID=A0A5N6PJT1_9ASTR|nr:hypothetical protein E3N88_08977 [Mikania micrantha]